MATRIMYVITKANWGGAQRYVYDMARAAQVAGHSVAVVYGLPAQAGEKGELASRLAGEQILAFHLPTLARDIGILRDFRSFLALLSLFRHERPDIVHVNSSKAGGLSCLAARIAGIPHIIFTAHGWAFNESRAWWQKAVIYKLVWLTILLSHKTICVSNAVFNDVAWMPFIRSKCIVIYNGVACEKLLTKEAARKSLAPPVVAKYWIGMLSELHPTKRVDDAIFAFALIAERHPEAALIVLGEGERRHELEQRIRDLHMSKRVILLGTVTDARHYLRAFDLFVHASASEALGLGILEAGCASLPVVATKVGGIPEIIPDNDHGLLVPPREPRALAEAMETLMDDPRRAAELGARLRARVTQIFKKEKMLSQTLALYSL